MDKPKLILLVEDNEICAKYFTTILAHGFGCAVHHVKQGSLALDFLDFNKPDLIQMDIQLPGMSGWETIKIIGSKPELDGIPICVVTACGLERPELIGEERARAAEEMKKPAILGPYVQMIARQLFQVSPQEAEQIGILVKAGWSGHAAPH